MLDYAKPEVGPAVNGFALDARGSRIESQQGCLLRFNQLSTFTILNLIGTEVLIKIRMNSFLTLLMWHSEHMSNEKPSLQSNRSVHSGPGLHGITDDNI